MACIPRIAAPIARPQSEAFGGTNKVDTQGRRLDVGQLFAEGEPVDCIDALRWDGRAYSVAFSISRDGAVERREQRVSAPRSVAFHSSLRHLAPRFM